MGVLDVYLSKAFLQGGAIKVRVPARIRERAYIGDPLDVMSSEQIDKGFKWPCRMADRPDGGLHTSVCHESRAITTSREPQSHL